MRRLARSFLLPLLAAALLGFAVLHVVRSTQAVADPPPPADDPADPLAEAEGLRAALADAAARAARLVGALKAGRKEKKSRKPNRSRGGNPLNP